MNTQSRCVHKLVLAFGGASAMARALGHDYASTVQSWKQRGVIPRWRINEIRSSPMAQLNAEVRGLLDELEVAQRNQRRSDRRSQQDKCALGVTETVNEERIPSGCRYISGDPRGEWSYCNRPRRKGSSYCDEHHEICYRTVSAKAARREAETTVTEATPDTCPDHIVLAPLPEQS